MNTKATDGYTEYPQLPQLKVALGWIDLEATSEPRIIFTRRGYAPVLPVRAMNNELEYNLFIGAFSISEPLEAMRKANAGAFKGIRFRIRKQSLEQFAKYEIEGIP